MSPCCVVSVLFLHACMLLFITFAPCDAQKPDCPHRKCSRDWKPVCSSNKITYINQCEFLDANCRWHNNRLTSSPGSCSQQKERKTRCICFNELQPMCGSDGKTYNNPCLYTCAKRNNNQLTAVRGKCPA